METHSSNKIRKFHGNCVASRRMWRTHGTCAIIVNVYLIGFSVVAVVALLLSLFDCSLSEIISKGKTVRDKEQRKKNNE